MRLFANTQKGGKLVASAILLSQLLSSVQAFHHGAAHAHHHRALNKEFHARAESAEAIVANALKVLEVVNKDLVDHPAFNQEVFADQPTVAGLSQTAPPLDYLVDPLSLKKRTEVRRNTGGTHQPYTIPSALADAARIVAESKPQVPKGDHAKVAANIRAKYAHNGGSDSIRAAKRDLSDATHLEARDGFEGDLERRASRYWLIDSQQYPGKSPYAPANYKVWRNVMDYGAKGDGVADDTAAINKAISDGGRCGLGCGSSTVYPAMVYFPPGTYLVSSPIIQYYNTQFLGDPSSVPTLLAASSFVGLGVISSDVYISDTEEWYLNTNNFLRSVKNFKIDMRLASTSATLCAIHWQVAQGTSLENIEIYMVYNNDVPSNTQRGIFMENGSGGFLADVTFVGGNVGAYFGNQQFTTSHLVFVNCETAVQVFWDWAWTMQGFVIESCGTGLVVTGGAGGTKPPGSSVGSLILVDSLFANTPNGIQTGLYGQNTTSLLLQNVGFFNVATAVRDTNHQTTLLAGGNQVYVKNWGFGRVYDTSGQGSFVSGANIPTMNRAPSLLGTAFDNMQPNFYTRRRPTYYDVPASKVINVKAMGAKGDGKTDDTKAINSILQKAAAAGSIVYFPYGVYIITDTLLVPRGSKLIGQVWSQIMATGVNFQDETKPRVAVRVTVAGSAPAVVEIQDLMITVSGPTAGAVLMEWNAKESSQGSAGMWDTHFRVGGAKGSQLQKADCPKLPAKANPKCKAASLLLHLTPSSTAYLENIWVWTADHDLDSPGQEQIDVYAARGVLIESARAWLWGTASEHNILYQYQLSGAQDVVLGMIQTETPYYQPKPAAAQPYKPGLFANDPSFATCTTAGCAMAWAVRVVNSQSIYFLGTGLYSFFSGYTQSCLDTNSCQQRGFDLRGSKDTWIYNLGTKAMIEMLTPAGKPVVSASANQNGFLASITAWLGASAP